MQSSGHNRLQISHDSHSLKPRQRWAPWRASSLMSPNSTGENPFLRFLSGRVLRLGLRTVFFSHALIITCSDCGMQNAECGIFRNPHSEMAFTRDTDRSIGLPSFRQQWHRLPTLVLSLHPHPQKRLSCWFHPFPDPLVSFHLDWSQTP
jgi:hypothetical protein